MKDVNETDGEPRPRVPAWFALIVINLISFGIVAALVGASALVDALLFDLG